MKFDAKRLRKLLILMLPYLVFGLLCTNIGEAFRLAEGAGFSAKVLALFTTLETAFSNPLPSFYPVDLLIGVICGIGLRLVVYL